MIEIEGFEALKNQDEIMKDMEVNNEYIEWLVSYLKSPFVNSKLLMDRDFYNSLFSSSVSTKLLERVDKLFYFYETVKKYVKEYHLEINGSEVHDYYTVKYEDSLANVNHLEIGCVYFSQMKLDKNGYYCKKLDKDDVRCLDQSNILDFNKVLNKNKEKQLKKQKKNI